MVGTIDYYPGDNAPSLIKQIQCPSDPPSAADSGNFKGIAFAGGQAFPEAIGQLIGGNFTGLGKNEDSFWGKTGLDFVNGYSGSKRIYGQNYYLPLDGKVCGLLTVLVLSVSYRRPPNRDPSRAEPVTAVAVVRPGRARVGPPAWPDLARRGVASTSHVVHRGGTAFFCCG